MNEKYLMTGNEACARGAYEAGVQYASAYPGTPSTEILENLAGYRGDIVAEWATNEKVALEAAYGACKAGARTMVSMKHVGLNVAADPLFTTSYTGVNGGMIIVTADEPGYFSSQNEQDNRNYAYAAKLPMFEPSNSQETLDMVKEAYNISEQFDSPIILRMTTRVCHSKSIVELSDRIEVPIREYKKDVKANIPVPAFVTGMRKKVQDRQESLISYSNACKWNYAENNDTRIGIVTSGVSYHYAKEAFGDQASYLKLGFTNPMPDDLISEFCSKYDTLYVIEENDPYIEKYIREQGFKCHGKDVFPYTGEMNTDVIRKSVNMEPAPTIEFDESKIVSRPPTLCAGCPHRGMMISLGKRKDVVISGDIGCYSLSFSEPYNAMDYSLCMGAAFSMGHGSQKVFDMDGAPKKLQVVSFMGDSTFFHTGMNSLLNASYNNSNSINIILDNRITGMTGHQENPGTGYTAQGDLAPKIDIAEIVRSFGIDQVRVIDPNDLTEVDAALDWAFSLTGCRVIITRWPCVLKKLSKYDKAEFKNVFTEKCTINRGSCIGCRKCIGTGCPALSFDSESKKASIDSTQCVGCTVCLQSCPVNAISKEEK